MSTGFELLSTPDSEASRNSSHGETRVVLSAACLAVVRLWRWGSIKNFNFLQSHQLMSGTPVRRSDAPDASQSEICKQLARVVLDFAKLTRPVFLTQPANRGIGIIVYKDPRNSRVDVPEYDLMVTESRMV